MCHKKRAIDLRTGDEMVFKGRWTKIAGIRANWEDWLRSKTPEECAGDDGYIVTTPCKATEQRTIH